MAMIRSQGAAPQPSRAAPQKEKARSGVTEAGLSIRDGGKPTQDDLNMRMICMFIKWILARPSKISPSPGLVPDDRRTTLQKAAARQPATLREWQPPKYWNH